MLINAFCELYTEIKVARGVPSDVACLGGSRVKNEHDLVHGRGED